ncbi:hypothetical protein [Actinocorallia aurantiaca]|uniref:Lipoprotein n=1 Tax=Actinocorallia aurantiaca TaxID=46204 RepID=A0ABP6GE97_9ACTN
MIRKVALLAVAGSLALTGCGAGTNAESSKPTQLTEGVNFSQHGIDVRNLFVLGPVPGAKLPIGSSLSVYGSLINNASSESDALTGVTVEGGLVELGTVKGGAVELPAHEAVNLAQPAGQASPSASPSAAGATTEPSQTPASPSQAPTGQAPTGQAEEKSQDGGSAVVLKNTKKVFFGGEYLRLTLQFRNAQAITVSVQVIPAQGEYSTLAPATKTTPSPSQTASPSTEGEHGEHGEEAGEHGETTVEATPAANPTATATKKAKKKQEQHES